MFACRAEYGIQAEEATRLKEEVDGRVKGLEEELSAHTGKLLYARLSKGEGSSSLNTHAWMSLFKRRTFCCDLIVLSYSIRYQPRVLGIVSNIRMLVIIRL